MHAEKFIDPFIDFIEKNFPDTNQHYIIRRSKDYEVRERSSTILLPRRGAGLRRAWTYIKEMNRAEKIFLHSIVHRGLMWLIVLQPWLMRKIHLLMWGNELYFHLRIPRGPKGWIQQHLNALIIRNSAVLMTFLDEDYFKARDWFGARGRYEKCLLYPSNLCPKGSVSEKDHNENLTILIGNSATATNCHNEIFENIRNFWSAGTRLYCPLSYGDPVYGENVARAGFEMFGNDFIPLLNFLPLEQYNKILQSVDVVIFGHNRMQAMGNLISLIAMKKKIYLRPETSQWKLMWSLGVTVYDFNDLAELSVIDKLALEKNSAIVREKFTEERLAEQYSRIFQAI